MKVMVVVAGLSSTPGMTVEWRSPAASQESKVEGLEERSYLFSPL